MSQQDTHRQLVIKLAGGLDRSTSPLFVFNGCCVGSENYEPVITGGYRRVGGYERYSGMPAPSAAEVVVLGGSPAWTTSAVVGASVTGAVSGATGVIAYKSDDATQIAVTKVVGAFVNAEQLLVSGIPIGLSVMEPSVSVLTLNAMLAAAADIYREDIEAPPGEGPLCGVCVVDDVLYAFRNNVGSTKQDVWKATTAGWVAIDYPSPYRIRFNTGSGSYINGATVLTQGSVTATVHRLMVEDGSFDGGDASGAMILRTASSGGSFSDGAATLTDGSTVVLEAVTYAAANLFPSGRWRFVPYRFAGQTFTITDDAAPVYGVDTYNGMAGNFIEFDGLCAVPLTAGGLDGPTHIEAHKQHLFATKRGSVQFSGIGEPYKWVILEGAGEFLAGESVTAMVSVQGNQDEGAMAILCRNKSAILYGNSSDDWNLVPLSRQVGAKPYSAQIMGVLLAVDEQGVRSYAPTQDFGNFSFNTLTDHIRAQVNGKTPTASVVDRAGGRYRCFFDDGTWLSGVPGKRWSWMFCRYPFTVTHASEWEIDGVSRVFVGGEDGFVYECDKGRSFDGEPIEAWLKTSYAHMGSPGVRKAFRRTDLEIRGDSAGELRCQADYSYGDVETDLGRVASVVNNPIAAPASPWDIGEWDNGTWDGQYQGNVRIRSAGVGENLSHLFYSNSGTELPHELTAMTVHYFFRRRTR